MVWAPLATCLGCKLYERLFMPEDRGEGFSPVQVITTGLGISAARGSHRGPADCATEYSQKFAARPTEGF